MRHATSDSLVTLHSPRVKKRILCEAGREDAVGVLEDERRDGAGDEDAEHVHNHLREGGRLYG